MTHSGGKPHAVGDRGQRYEITVFDKNQKKRIKFGWAETKEGAEQMAEAAVLHPSWQDPIVHDRKPDSK